MKQTSTKKSLKKSGKHIALCGILLLAGTSYAQPPNNECTGAIPAPVNPNNNCTQTLAGTTISATSSGDMGPCNFSDDDPDVYFSFTAINTQHRFIISAFSAADHVVNMSIRNGSNCNISPVCTNNDTLTYTGLIVGDPYYLWIKTSTAQNFTVCITTPVPLPVSLSELTGSVDGGKIMLRWDTYSEQFNKGFDVMRSEDGKTFSPIGWVPSHAKNGNSHEKLAYSYIDAAPLSGTNYYRLRQVDFDGKSAYSNIEQVTFGTASGIRIYPNPATRTVTIEAAEGSKIAVYNMIGQRIAVPATRSNRLSVLDVSALAAGNYTIQVLDDSGISSHKFTVVK